jgi:hypothetical protein
VNIVATKADLRIPTTDHGSYAHDLRAFLDASYLMANDPQIADLLRALMAEGQINPEFGERFRTAFLQRRRQAFAVITDRASQRGDLPAPPGPGTTAGIVFGTIWYRILATGQPFDDQLIEDLVAMLTAR